MINNLLSHIQSTTYLSTAAIQALHDNAQEVQLARKEHLIKPGQRCDKIWFLVEGMVRKYKPGDGKEITCWIHTENEWLTSVNSYMQQQPSQEYIEACEESILFSINRESTQTLASYPDLQQYANRLMQQAMVDIETHTTEFNQRDARGKYEYLQQIAPEMCKRAQLGHIASILHISQETLSRIRKS